MKKQQGFSLTELLIAVVIIGILAGYAVPSYQKSVLKSARGEGMTDMLDLMRSQENFFANNYTYTTDLTHLGHQDPYISSNGNYSVVAVKCSTALELDQCIKLIGTAIGNQSSDGDLILDSRGDRKHNGKNGWIH